jgi:hypothetical protein
MVNAHAYSPASRYFKVFKIVFIEQVFLPG